MPISRLIDKQNAVYTYKEYYSDFKMEWNSDTCYKTNDSTNYYAKWNRSDTKV